MKSIYIELLEKLESRKFAQIDLDSYKELCNNLIISFYVHEHNGDKIPDDYFELQKWVYDRIAKDVVYQDTGYLNDHFCIGVIFGMLFMFDDSIYCKSDIFDAIERIKNND